MHLLPIHDSNVLDPSWWLTLVMLTRWLELWIVCHWIASHLIMIPDLVISSDLLPDVTLTHRLISHHSSLRLLHHVVDYWWATGVCICHLVQWLSRHSIMHQLLLLWHSWWGMVHASRRHWLHSTLVLTNLIAVYLKRLAMHHIWILWCLHILRLLIAICRLLSVNVWRHLRIVAHGIPLAGPSSFLVHITLHLTIRAHLWILVNLIFTNFLL